MKKIGIVAQYLQSRNDIREVIARLAEEYEVYLYLRKADLTVQIPGVTYREITDRRRTVRNQLLIRTFYLFGRLPRSRNNYYITESFKIENTKTKAIFKAEKRTLLQLSKVLPKWMSYDRYLDELDCADTTPVDDVDTFLFFSEVYDDYLLSHVLRKGKRVQVFVYSWDHPCKMTKFSHRVQRYLVWNAGLKEDLVTLQGVEPARVRVVGSSQLAYIAEFGEGGEPGPRPFPFEYLYFGCATGTPALVGEEVKIIGQLAQVLAEAFPQVRLVVRPYPFLGAWQLYEPLKAHANVHFDTYRTAPGAALSREQIYEKFVKVKFARAFIHIGTTMGYEAAYFDTPVLQVNFQAPGPGGDKLRGFIHQYQNDKYLMPEGYPNVIAGPADFREKLVRLMAAPEAFRQYNRHVAGQTRLANFTQFCAELSKAMHAE